MYGNQFPPGPSGYGGRWRSGFPPRAPRMPHRFHDLCLDEFPQPRYGGRSLLNLTPDPYMRMMLQRRHLNHRPPRPRLGIPDFSTQQFRKRLLKPAIRTPSAYKKPIASQTLTKGKDGNNAAKPSVNGENKEPKKVETEVKEIKKEDPPASSDKKPAPVAREKRISAKQMWESSYLETVAENTSSNPPAPAPTSSKPPFIGPNYSKPASKFKKKNKGRRPPYFKKRGKKANTDKEKKDDEFPRMCDVCNILLTGEEQAKVHDTSDMHKQNMTKAEAEKPKHANMTLDKLNESLPLPTNTPECLVWGKDTGDRTLNTIRFCRLCSVSMTSLPNAKQHYAGKSHAKRIRIVQRGNHTPRKPFTPTHFISGGVLGMQSTPKPSYTYSKPPTQQAFQPQTQVVQHVTDIDSAPGTTSINLKPALPGDFANSMTPSGQYYCSTCNIVIKHAGNLNAHLQSKAHKQAKKM